MTTYKETWKPFIAEAINALLVEAGLTGSVSAQDIIAEDPPKPEMGDIGFPMFGFAKLLRKSPAQIAASVASVLAARLDAGGGTISAEAASVASARSASGNAAFSTGSTISGTAAAEGPYVNVRLDRGAVAAALLGQDPADIGRPGTLAGKRIMVEFSSPNTNKPLHLGHLRNDILGESVSRILRACGADVRKVCIINDRGVHICKSMLAYQQFGEGKTPESEGVKSDRFVGDWYVKFHQMEVEDEAAKEAGRELPHRAEEQAQEMLRKWEAGDEQTTALWKQMNGWAVEGMKKTYERTGVSFDQYYFESKTYLLGKDEIYKGLEKGIFYKAEDGAVMIDLSAENLDQKALLRKDGTSIYITQDIGTAIFRHNDWPFDRLIYVVGSEQQYHFKVLFSILRKLGYEWAEDLCHLSYGMVNLPEGRMKSREGTVVDADDLINNLKDMALKEIREKEREEAVGNLEETSEKIALGALHYYLLQVSAAKDMLFNPAESLSFNGNTGPYLQYMGARISALLRNAALQDNAAARPAPSKPDAPASAADGLKAGLVCGDAEWDLIKTLLDYGRFVAESAQKMDSSVLAGYLYALSKSFSRFYHDCPILNADTPDLASARLALSKLVLVVLKDALYLTGIPFLEAM